MDKRYKDLVLEIIPFENADVITDSDDTEEINPGGNNNGNN